MRQIAIFIITISICHAQSMEFSAFGGGGISTSWGKRFPLENTESIFGVCGGTIVSYNFDNINTIRLETQYDGKGSIDSGVSNIKHYITISPMMQFHVSEKVKLYFLIGPFFGILANKQPYHNPYDAGIIGGIGYKQNLWKKKLFAFVECKEYFGLANTEAIGYANTNKFNVTLGLSFRLNFTK